MFLRNLLKSAQGLCYLFIFFFQTNEFFYMYEAKTANPSFHNTIIISASALLVLRWKSELGVWTDLSVIERRPGPFQDVIKSAVCLKARWTWPLMRTQLSCKQWLEEVSHKGVTVSPGHWYSPPLSSIEMASLEAARDTGMMLNQTRHWDGNDIFSCCEHGGQIVLVFDFKLLNFCPLSHKFQHFVWQPC